MPENKRSNDVVTQREMDKFESRNIEDHARLETKIDNLAKKVDDNFKWLLGMILGQTAFLGTLMALFKFVN